MGVLYLIPTTLGDGNLQDILPMGNSLIISSLRYFIVENIRSARRFLKSVDKSISIDDICFYELNEHTDRSGIDVMLQPLYEGHSVGIISEAGCPAIADPGADVVALAQTKNIEVVPLVGPSSIILSLMASGFNGQNFAFLGYLPIDKKARIQRLKQLEGRAVAENQTQIFIEAPYRNNQLLQDIFSTLQPTTKLCIASELTTTEQYIRTQTISQWRHIQVDFNKKNTIFLIYK